MEKATLRTVVEGLAVASWRNLYVGLWRGNPTMAAVDELARQYRAMAARAPSFASIIIVEESVALPEDRVRTGISEAMRDVTSSVTGMIGVQEATGFRGAAIRSVILALSMTARVPYKTSTVATVKDAAPWLVQFVTPAATAMQIETVITSFREDLAASHPMPHGRT